MYAVRQEAHLAEFRVLERRRPWVELFGRATLDDRDLVDMYEADRLHHPYTGMLSLSELIRAQPCPR